MLLLLTRRENFYYFSTFPSRFFLAQFYVVEITLYNILYRLPPPPSKIPPVSFQTLKALNIIVPSYNTLGRVFISYQSTNSVFKSLMKCRSLRPGHPSVAPTALLTKMTPSPISNTRGDTADSSRLLSVPVSGHCHTPSFFNPGRN